MVFSQASGRELLIYWSSDTLDVNSSSLKPSTRQPMDFICPSMFRWLNTNQCFQRSMVFSDGQFSESASSGPMTPSSTPDTVSSG